MSGRRGNSVGRHAAAKCALDSGLGDMKSAGAYANAYYVAGESLDSGLGELPAYALWKDKSGRNPMGTQALQVASHLKLDALIAEGVLKEICHDCPKN